LGGGKMIQPINPRNTKKNNQSSNSNGNSNSGGGILVILVVIILMIFINGCPSHVVETPVRDTVHDTAK
jgi:hypothetical protein